MCSSPASCSPAQSRSGAVSNLLSPTSASTTLFDCVTQCAAVLTPTDTRSPYHPHAVGASESPKPTKLATELTVTPNLRALVFSRACAGCLTPRASAALGTGTSGAAKPAARVTGP